MARRESASIEEQADRIVRQLGGKWQGDFAMCRCPAHADGKASLSIRVGERAVLFHCFAGCTADAIMSALRTGKILAPANHDPGQRQDSKTDLNKLALAVWRHAEPFAGTLADRYLREGRSIVPRSEEHKSELQLLMRISSAVFCLNKKNKHTTNKKTNL